MGNEGGPGHVTEEELPLQAMLPLCPKVPVKRECKAGLSWSLQCSGRSMTSRFQCYARSHWQHFLCTQLVLVSCALHHAALEIYIGVGQVHVLDSVVCSHAKATSLQSRASNGLSMLFGQLCSNHALSCGDASSSDPN